MKDIRIVLLDPQNTHPRSAKVGWITDENGCDIWQGTRNGHGYAQVRRGDRLLHVQRLRYEREVGPIPEGAYLDHFVCDNGPGGCCNPRHCRPASHRENLLRSESMAAINLAKTHCPKGHALSGDNLSGYDARQGWRKCKRCVTDRSNARRLADPEGTRIRKAEYYQRNKERIKAKSNANYRKRRANAR